MLLKGALIKEGGGRLLKRGAYIIIFVSKGALIGEGRLL